MAEPGSARALRSELAQIEAALASHAALRGALPEEQLAAVLRALEERRETVRARLAKVEKRGNEDGPGASDGGAGVSSDAPSKPAVKRRRRGVPPSTRASVAGGGAAAQGRGATAAGRKGVAISGGVGRDVKHAGRDLLEIHLTAQGETGASLETSYLTWLFERLRALSLAAVDPAVAAGKATDARLELDAVYTGLMTQGQEGGPADGDGGPSKRLLRRGSGEMEVAGGLTPALAQLDRHRRLVLLGDPGSGKSTFVAFVALCLAAERLGRSDASLALLCAPLPDERGAALRATRGEGKPEPQPWGHGSLLPVRIVLRDFAARGLPPAGERASACHLWDFLRTELDRATLGGYAEALERHLREEGGLVLLDGLDEVPEAEKRRVQIRQAVEDFASAFGRCRILVTSRTYAYRQQEWRLAGFAEAVLAPFGPAQVARFVERWYAHLAALGRYGADDARGRAALLRQRIEASDRLRALAERPLLLTLMASLHAWHGADLPERRERLYAAAVDLLLDLWERRRLEYEADGRPVLVQPSVTEWLALKDKEPLRALLDELAYKAHAAQPEAVGTADLPEGDLVAGLMRLGPGAAAVNPSLLIEFLRDRAGLIEPRGVGVYTFPHRTFQEYLAACHLTRGDFPEEVADLARRQPDRWREVALLAGAKAASGTTAAVWSLAARLCFREPGDPEASAEDVWGAHLAAQALVEVLGAAGLAVPSPANRPLLDRVRRWLVALIRGSELPALERALAGDNLSRIGDPRPEVVVVDGMEFCWVPAGRFWMGSGEEDPEALRDEQPAGVAELPRGFWLGRYPVTAAQFGEFVAAGGYAEGRYWLEAAAAGVWTAEGVRGAGESDPRREPFELPDPWRLAARPMVGVTWYESLAFCRWLAERWVRAGWLPEGWVVGLPSEGEWEKAARGGLDVPQEPLRRRAADGLAGGGGMLCPNETPRRRYPWGDGFEPERANASASGIGSTSAVGCCSAGESPYGVEELSGNCWEWTRSLGGDYPYPAPGRKREAREKLASRGPRVLRGGSYFDDPWRVRCAVRNLNHPGVRYVFIGFRVVVLPPFFSEL